MSEYGVAPLDLRLTEQLCARLSATQFEDLPAKTRHEAKRALLDWIGCAVAGSRHAAIPMVIDVLASTGSGRASVINSPAKLPLLQAPIANGQMGHILDYDDTHMDGVVLHGSSPLFSGLIALAEARGASGKQLITAFIVGFDAAVRAGKAAPAHHDGGWHLTGTLGAIGAGVACGRLIDLDPAKMTFCAGVATTQAAGMQQNRGTHCKSFHAGRAGSNGVLAAILAEKGFDSSSEILEGRRGFTRIFSAETDEGALTRDLGARWELDSNGYKPYACGIVQHPLIDAMIALSEQTGAALDEVERVTAQVHPHAVKITGVEEPETGLKSKFSLKHSAAIGFLDRTAGVAQYSDARAVAEDAKAMRAKIAVETVESFRKDEAKAAIRLANGARLQVHVEHASGTTANPLSDAKIEAKFLENAAPSFGEDRARRIAQTVWRLEQLADVTKLLDDCVG